MNPLINKEIFIKLIESIGFKYYGLETMDYKDFLIGLYDNYYTFYFDYNFGGKYYYTDLEPINYHFKKELRTIKLKQLLR